MKNKILASLLAVCLFVGLAVPAFAVDGVHQDENRVAKISFDKASYEFGDVSGISLDSLLTAYDAQGNRMIFNDEGATDSTEIVYKSENESILDVTGDTLVLVRNADKAVKVRITAHTSTDKKAEVTINVPAGTAATIDTGAKGYTVEDTNIYYLNDNVGTANTAASFIIDFAAGDLKVGKNTIKIGSRTTTVTLTDVIADTITAFAAAEITLVTDSGRNVTFKAADASTLTGATAAVVTGSVSFVAKTEAELGSIRGIAFTSKTDRTKGTLSYQVNARPVGSNTSFKNGTTDEKTLKTLTIKPVGGEFTQKQLDAFSFKIGAHTTNTFETVDTANESIANLKFNAVDGTINFTVDTAKLDAAKLPEDLIGKKAYVHVYNTLFASAQTYKSATISIVGEEVTASVGLPSVINVGVGQNLDLRTVTSALKDKNDGYKIAPYLDQTAVEANRIAKVLADTNYMVRGIAVGTTTLMIGDTQVKLVVGPGKDYENDGYKDPSINPIISLTVGAKYTIAVKDAGTIAPIFSSYDNKIATVDANGVVTAVAPGVIKIKVVTGPNTDTRKDLYATVTVKAAPAVVDPTTPDVKPTTPPSTGVSFFAL